MSVHVVPGTAFAELATCSWAVSLPMTDWVCSSFEWTRWLRRAPIAFFRGLGAIPLVSPGIRSSLVDENSMVVHALRLAPGDVRGQWVADDRGRRSGAPPMVPVR